MDATSATHVSPEVLILVKALIRTIMILMGILWKTKTTVMDVKVALIAYQHTLMPAIANADSCKYTQKLK